MPCLQLVSTCLSFWNLQGLQEPLVIPAPGRRWWSTNPQASHWGGSQCHVVFVCISEFSPIPLALRASFLPSWNFRSFISFALPCLRCSSPPSHVGVSHTKRKRFMEIFHNSYFHFSNISSDVTCSENSWSGIRWISPSAPNLPWLCPVVGWSSLQTPLLSPAGFARLHNRWHQTRRNLEISRREKGLGSFLLPCFCQCHHDNGNGLYYLIFYFILASCTPNPAAMGDSLPGVLHPVKSWVSRSDPLELPRSHPQP